jgi:hypothetical protein
MKILLKILPPIFLLLVLVLVECRKNPQANDKNQIGIMVEPTEIRTYPNYETDVDLDKVETAVNEPLSSATITPELFYGCILPISSDKINLSGNLVLWESSKNHLMLLNTEDGLQSSFQNSTYNAIESPDASRIVFLQESPREIVLVSSDGNILQRNPIPETWISLIDWITDNVILIEKRIPEISASSPSSIISYNLLSGDFQEYLPEYPEIDTLVELFPHWGGKTVLFPNNTFDHMIYASNDGGVILWDLITKTEVIHIFLRSGSISPPDWSQNGKWFITSAPASFTDLRGNTYTNFEEVYLHLKDSNELLMVNTSGEIQALTHFSAQVNASLSGWVLSPDETKVAFWLDSDDDPYIHNWNLAILEISSEFLSIICISAGDTDFPLDPIWSPDGLGIMVTSYDSYPSTPPEVRVLNLVHNEVYVLPENAQGIGWILINE